MSTEEMLTKVLVDSAVRTIGKRIQARHQVRNLGELLKHVVLEGLLGLFHLRRQLGNKFDFHVLVICNYVAF